jgi:hypothetical protein
MLSIGIISIIDTTTTGSLRADKVSAGREQERPLSRAYGVRRPQRRAARARRHRSAALPTHLLASCLSSYISTYDDTVA